MKVNNLVIKVCSISALSVLVLALSKEGIIYLCYIAFMWDCVFVVLVIGGMLTCFYSSKLIKFCFSNYCSIFICYLFYNCFAYLYFVIHLL